MSILSHPLAAEGGIGATRRIKSIQCRILVVVIEMMFIDMGRHNSLWGNRFVAVAARRKNERERVSMESDGLERGAGPMMPN